MQVGAVARNDPGRFLPAMLQCVKTEIGELGRLGMAEYAEDAAFVVEVIVEKDVRRGHGMCSARTSELAQASRRESSGDRIAARPRISMRKSAPRVTRPISRAATPYCLAISRTRAIEPGATETTARAPRSPKRANSAGAVSSKLTLAPSRGATCCAPSERSEERRVGKEWSDV